VHFEAIPIFFWWFVGQYGTLCRSIGSTIFFVCVVIGTRPGDAALLQHQDLSPRTPSSAASRSALRRNR